MRISDVTMPIAVVLPAPFGPSSAKKSPSRTVRSMPFSASTPLPIDLSRSLMTNASMNALRSARAPRAAIVRAAARGATNRGRSQTLACGGGVVAASGSDARLQRHQRELPAQLGPRRREETLPEPVALAKRAVQDAGHARELLQIGERQPRTTARCRRPIEPEQQPRLKGAVSARVPRREQDRQTEVVLALRRSRRRVRRAGRRGRAPSSRRNSARGKHATPSSSAPLADADAPQPPPAARGTNAVRGPAIAASRGRRD